MLTKEQLEKIVFPGPVDVGGAQSPIVTEMAIELLESRAESLSLREQLEAERQRADTLQTERDEFRRRLKLERSILEDTEKQLAELRALEPFGYIDSVQTDNWNYINLKGETSTVAFISKTADGLMRKDYAMPLFTAAKPAEK
ncbi:particle associated protein [Yersinia phage fHe-Yen8-01]|nr:particle associated protein [Yersinia phage fHe-Yen8-01]